MKRSAIAIALASTLCMGPLVSQAQQSPSEAPVTSKKSFHDLDTNVDGRITIDEANQDPMLRDRFSEADVNRNSEVDVSEFSVFAAKSEKTGEQGSPTPGKVVSFEMLDLNKDYRVSRDEANVDPTLSQQYSTVDQDRDGYISSSEFSAFEARQGGQAGATGGSQISSFEQLDTNKDGVLGANEIKGNQQLEQQLSTIDSNRDGSISKQEYQSAMAPTAPSGQAPSGAVAFQSIDANKNGWISPSEASADPSLGNQFSQIDKDRNGFIDQSEFSAWETQQSGSMPMPR